MQRNATKALICICLMLLFIYGLTPKVQAGKGTGAGPIALLVNTQEYDIRVDISFDTAGIIFTVPPADDTAWVPVSMYATDTDGDSGLYVYEIHNTIYYDNTEMYYVGYAVEDWDDNYFTVSESVYQGDTSQIVVHAHSDTLTFESETWKTVYSLKFRPRCNVDDELELGLDFHELSSENNAKVVGSGDEEQFDSIDNGYAFIMPYWINMDIDDVETLLGDDTVLVPVYIESSNYRFWAFENYLRFDSANYDFVTIERGEDIISWFDLGCGSEGDSIFVSFATISGYVDVKDTPSVLYTLVFASKADEDSLISDITKIECDSNFFLPKSCNYFWEDIDLAFEAGKIEVPEYNFEVALEFGDAVEPGEYATLHVNVRGNFPAGKPNGDLDLLLRPDRRLLGDSCVNVYASINLLVARLQDSLITINLLPSTPGYIPDSDTFVTLCDLLLELDDTATYDCPDQLAVDYKYFYDNGYRCYCEDTTGNVYCGYYDGGTSNDKMEFTSDALEPLLPCGEIYATNASGSDRAYQHIYVTHYFDLDSIYVELDYDNSELYFGSASKAGGLTVEEVDANTIRIRGSNLDWSAAEDVWLARILWCAKKDYQQSSTVDVCNSEVFDTDDTEVEMTETDATVSTNRDPWGAYIPCPNHPPRKEEARLPEQFSLYQNRPNPFNPLTIISFELPEARHVKLEVFNILGQRITGLVDDYLGPGRYDIEWNAGKEQVSSGVYFYIIRAGDYVESRKMMLLK